MIRVLELFGGIGACSKALERLGVGFETVDYVEIDKFAVKSFNAIRGTNFEPQDIRNWDKSADADLIMHGSPCQDFSIAGKQAGGDKGSGTRSSLMYEALRIVEKSRPRYVIWENVKNVLSAKHRHNFGAYLESLEELGYANFYQVLNAKGYGVPQNRERVFTVSILRTMAEPNPVFVFPKEQPLTKRLKDVLEDGVDEKYYLSNEQVARIAHSSYDQVKRFYDVNGLSPTLSTMGGGWRWPKIDGARIRRLTPKECWRLMGFDDEDYEKSGKSLLGHATLQTGGEFDCRECAGGDFEEFIVEGML